MQETSLNWNKMQEQDVITAPAYLEVKLTVTDPELYGAAEATVTEGEEFYSNVKTLLNDTDILTQKIMTCEHNLNILSGGFVAVDQDPPHVKNGYIGTQFSADDGNYENPPIITIELPKTFKTLLEGISIAWGTAYDAECADTFKVTVYSDSDVVLEKTVSGNRDKVSKINYELESYSKVTVEILKWSLPVHRPRVAYILLGIEHTYLRDAVTQYSHAMECDLLSNELPTVDISFEVDNLDMTFDPDNDTGLSKYLMTRQRVATRYGYTINGSIEVVKGGIAYLDDWETPRNSVTAKFKASSLLTFMDDKFTGTTTTKTTLYDLTVMALEASQIPPLQSGEVPWLIDDALKTLTVPSSADLKNYTNAEIVQLAANAACCIVYQSRDGILHVEPYTLPNEIQSEISTFYQFGYPQTSLSQPLKQIRVNDDYLLSVAESGATKEIKNPLIASGAEETVAKWARDILLNRQNLNGECRIDPNVDILDSVNIDTPFRRNRAILTYVGITFNGAFRGKYEGTVFPIAEESEE